VFNNLIKNALQAVPEGRRARISVTLRQAGQEAIAEVRDNGSGISEADRDRIFQPNFTTKSSGMGLGLAMVQRMVESARGRVWFNTSTSPGVTAHPQGTTFFVALPLHT
jgi:signal transduction histidine kinase